VDINGAVALVTGGNRGLGRAFVYALLGAGARKVYVGARSPFESDSPRLQPVRLDITNASDIATAATSCQDVTICVHNAGVGSAGTLLHPADEDSARREMETNYLGTLAMCRAFAPILKRNGGGALVNVLSVVSWYVDPALGTYSDSKAAEWAMTNGIRISLRAQGTLVVGVYAGFIDTDLTAGLDLPKARAEDIAAATVEAIRAGREQVLADTVSKEVRAALDADPEALNRQMQQLWDVSHGLGGTAQPDARTGALLTGTSALWASLPEQRS
jgi:NAD(P)-dependent dehydrogenase (short-subunit alcohol dehydrogenase family)